MTINGSVSLPQAISAIGTNILKNASNSGAFASGSPNTPINHEVERWPSSTSIYPNITSTSDGVIEAIGVSTTAIDSLLSFEPTSQNQEYLDILHNYTNNDILIDDPFDICSKWLPVNHIYFQLANTFLLLSYLAPNGIYGILYLRVTLTIGCFFFAIWGYAVLCAFDTIVWNAIFVVINFVHAIFICYYLRPVRFSAELEQVYKGLFEPLKVSRHQFKKALSCMKQIKQIKFQEIYAQEKITRVDSLSLVLSGRLVISQNGRALHIVSQHQFLDSPEWFGVSTDEFFQVTATAIEDSRILVWHRDKLKLSIMNDQFLQSVFDHILGRDVVKKLMQVNESLSGLSNGHCATPNYVDDAETKPLLIVKKSDDACGKTAILNRQLHVSDEWLA